MSDLVERLRGDLMTPYQATQLMDEAADRIEQLEAALRHIATPQVGSYGTAVCRNIARAALGERT